MSEPGTVAGRLAATFAQASGIGLDASMPGVSNGPTAAAVAKRLADVCVTMAPCCARIASSALGAPPSNAAAFDIDVAEAKPGMGGKAWTVQPVLAGPFVGNSPSAACAGAPKTASPSDAAAAIRRAR